ncbi:hypothetical protein FUA24_24305 [Seonamhaeicola marinus]|uniref:VOC domain-containing protein n=2 Tax=Seonamhaeicola marinus TaxID=1912246 RepID=A0A5D0H7M3_9FLAO|nr:hypothetical protein FUA24_24305 [Seonamhaeicola marinus]
MTNVCTSNLEESKLFYTKLFDFETSFESDWFVHLVSKSCHLELGLIDKTNDLVPEAYRKAPTGFYITFVVTNVDEIHSLALKEGFEVIKKPEDTFYGQRRLLLKDPDGTLVDVSAPIKEF